jgi:hypothetical protein
MNFPWMLEIESKGAVACAQESERARTNAPHRERVAHTTVCVDLEVWTLWRQDSERWPRRFQHLPTLTARPRHPRALSSRAELVSVLEQVRRVVKHAIGAGTLELLESVAARKQADSQCARTLRREHVPNAVANDKAVSYVNS